MSLINKYFDLVSFVDHRYFVSQAEDRDRGMEQESHSVQVRGISLFIGRVGGGGGGCKFAVYESQFFLSPPPRC